ncbi:MAG: CpsB/CapC family capsule biosynthesis tyrosine phosphatase [Thermoleophilia bacterium]
MPGFVDIHSHVVPSGDDGAADLEEGLALCRMAARHGTVVLFGTPHVWPYDGLSEAREREVRAAWQAMAEAAAAFGLTLELGFELTPAEARLDEDPARYRLGELDAVLVELPFRGELDLVVATAEHVEAAGLTPILAHPERSEVVAGDPARARELRSRGWLVQVNASSLLGKHGRREAAAGWTLVEEGTADLVASDGHRTSRPAVLDAAHAAARERVGQERADALFDGTALAGISRRRPPRSRAATPGA